MNRYVITHNEIEGYHYYPNAPQFCSYLQNKHRHVFVITCKFCVSNNEREIEIIEQQKHIKKAIKEKFGDPANFESMSCEAIADWLMCFFTDMYSCKVLEDGYGGAALSK